MTTAHRPTFDPARGKEALRGPAYHQRLLPAHTQLKFRKPGQGGTADQESRDLRAELLAAEAAHHAKLHGGPVPHPGDDDDDEEDGEAASRRGTKRGLLEGTEGRDDDDPGAKRRRILEESRAIDADDSDGSDKDSDDGGGKHKDDDDDDDDDSDSDDSDSDDEEAELQRELERVKRERQEKREREEREKAAVEAEQREKDIARGNPLLNKPDFTVKRRWDDDVVFKNQARGTEDKNKSKEFVNDMLRSDFHKRFMSKYVR
ncbi:Pre-mRNA-splicing factor Cwf15/Cwc15 [Coniella lustricola]|uniref:Pre-mRNA-splicing factor Cwf15/Cwc15 n=1 Tax=Coniella lustricola TaxID=2025994 RepID=A0A2T3A691_9PEZI|nr:Pre-mRNA-splicing factor Cwf15/Cwc15 [Coniella lustricola]